MTMARRVDLSGILKEIKTLLDDRHHLYLDVVRRFFMGKMPKPELDETCRKLLGKNVYLHNWFIVSLLNNAKVGPVAKLEPIGEELRAEGAGKKKRKAGFTEFPRKKRKLDGEEIEAGPHKQCYQSLAERCPKYSSLLVPSSGLSSNEHTRILWEMNRVKWAPPIAPLKIDRLSDLDAKMRTPAHFAIYERMTRISQENSVKEVTKDAVSLMSDALEIHLKNILSHAKPFLRRKKGNVYNAANFKERTDVIFPKDLLLVALLSPAVFGDNLSLALSRLKYAK